MQFVLETLASRTKWPLYDGSGTISPRSEEIRELSRLQATAQEAPVCITTWFRPWLEVNNFNFSIWKLFFLGQDFVFLLLGFFK